MKNLVKTNQLKARLKEITAVWAFAIENNFPEKDIAYLSVGMDVYQSLISKVMIIELASETEIQLPGEKKILEAKQGRYAQIKKKAVEQGLDFNDDLFVGGESLLPQLEEKWGGSFRNNDTNKYIDWI